MKSVQPPSWRHSQLVRDPAPVANPTGEGGIVAGEEIRSVASYVAVTLVLLLMTAANVGLALLDLHGLNTLVALAIATAEVIIMALFLMHLRWSAPMTRLASLVGLFWLAILMVGTMDDLLTRAWIPVPGK